MENHLADGVAVQGGVQRSPAVPCSPQSTALDPSTASALCEKCKTPVPAHGAFSGVLAAPRTAPPRGLGFPLSSFP